MGLFGQALYDLYHNESPEPFFVCNEQEESQIDLRFYLTPQPDSLEEALLAYAQGKCLDIGCGAGRIIRYLSAHGQSVVGIDIDAQLVQLCRELTDQTIYLLSWEDMETLGSFDSLLLCNRSLGIGGNIAGVKRLLKQCAGSVGRGGKLLFDSYEITGATGVLERTLRYKYRGQYSESFPWIHVCSGLAGQWLAEAGWDSERVIREGERYGIVARKV